MPEILIILFIVIAVVLFLTGGYQLIIWPKEKSKSSAYARFLIGFIMLFIVGFFWFLLTEMAPFAN